MTSNSHLRVLDAALFRALPAIDSGRVRLEPCLVGLAGDEIGLSRSAGTQKEWITSPPIRTSFTGTPVGMRISFAVLKTLAGSSLK